MAQHPKPTQRLSTPEASDLELLRDRGVVISLAEKPLFTVPPYSWVGLFRPEVSDELSKKNVPTDEVGDRAGSMGVSAGDTDSLPDSVVVVSLPTSYASRAATSCRKSECELERTARWAGGVASPRTSLPRDLRSLLVSVSGRAGLLVSGPSSGLRFR